LLHHINSLASMQTT